MKRKRSAVALVSETSLTQVGDAGPEVRESHGATCSVGSLAAINELQQSLVLASVIYSLHATQEPFRQMAKAFMPKAHGRRAEFQ